jgi:trehalose-phosphatase
LVLHLLSAWDEVKGAIRASRKVLFLSDYDGTLTPIVEKPEKADMPEENRRLLRALSRHRRFSVGIVSGRALPDLKDKVGLDGIIYAGNHGLEIEGPGMSFVNPLAEEIRPVLRVLHQVLNRTVGAIRGVFVEDKGLTLSVHYRLVEEQKAGDVYHEFERVVSGPRALGKVRITRGKKVLEVRPATSWDKGRAIALLIDSYGGRQARSGLLPVYLGDDATDEDGFRAIAELGRGVSVLVDKPRPASAARYYLESTGEVTQFLSLVADEAKRM